MTIKLSRQIFEKNLKLHENPCSWFLADGQTDRHDEANSRFLQFSVEQDKTLQ